MSARCTIVVARHKNVVRVPTNCVEIKGDKATVKIVTSSTKNGEVVETVTPRPVVTGLRGDDFVEIVSGLKEGEKLQRFPMPGRRARHSRSTRTRRRIFFSERRLDAGETRHP